MTCWWPFPIRPGGRSSIASRADRPASRTWPNRSRCRWPPCPSTCGRSSAPGWCVARAGGASTRSRSTRGRSAASYGGRRGTNGSGTSASIASRRSLPRKDRSHEGRSWPHYGRFIRLDRGRTIEHTWVSEATRGLESIVTVTIAPREGGTEVTLQHATVPDDEMGRGHQGGWTWYLDVLAERFEKVAAR